MDKFLEFINNIPNPWHTIIFSICLIISVAFTLHLLSKLNNYADNTYTREIESAVSKYLNNKLTINQLIEKREEICINSMRFIEYDFRRYPNTFNRSIYESRLLDITKDMDMDINEFIDKYKEQIKNKTENKSANKNNLVYIKVVAVTIYLISIVFSLGFLINVSKNSEAEFEKEQYIYSDLKNKRENYTYYLDGQEVDSDKIDLTLYNYRYNDEEECVYITHKHGLFS